MGTRRNKAVSPHGVIARPVFTRPAEPQPEPSIAPTKAARSDREPTPSGSDWHERLQQILEQLTSGKRR